MNMNIVNSSLLHPVAVPQRIAIFGAGVSGLAARRLAEAVGHVVCLFDERGGGDVTEFNESLLSDFDAFVFSPGFASGHPWRLVAESSGRPCYSELGFAARYWRGRVFGVTGTNGKTTITSLLCAALKSAGQSAIVAGNIGMPLSDYILNEANHDEAVAVCEISSFQAELPLSLELDGLIWSNFAEDHLDRYDTMAEYFAAKAKLLTCLKPRAPLVLGADVLAYDSSVARLNPTIVKATSSPLIDALRPTSPFCLYPQSLNLGLVAALFAAWDLPAQALLASANDFQLASHRLARVDAWGGATFWDDSKATNFHAALAAVDALAAPIYWIGGGSGKGGDLDGFAQAIAPKIKAAFLYGEVADALAERLRLVHERVETHASFVDAVEAAVYAGLADHSSNILLSPGFASFDQFSGYAERGKTFISTVFSLKDTVLRC
jgi:UDP-N-acetylmuramoylalanine--D-glutamate ligase